MVKYKVKFNRKGKRLTTSISWTKKKKTIWSVVPKSYRSIKNGKKYVLARHKTYGSILVPVTSSLAKKTWGKYLK